MRFLRFIRSGRAETLFIFATKIVKVRKNPYFDEKKKKIAVNETTILIVAEIAEQFTTVPIFYTHQNMLFYPSIPAKIYYIKRIHRERTFFFSS